MKTCKDCYHFDVCKQFNSNIPEEFVGIENHCDTFKDKSLVLDLPCEIGRTVFIIGSKYRHGRIEYWINTGKFKLSDIPKLEKNRIPNKRSSKTGVKGA